MSDGRIREVNNKTEKPNENLYADIMRPPVGKPSDQAPASRADVARPAESAADKPPVAYAFDYATFAKQFEQRVSSLVNQLASLDANPDAVLGNRASVISAQRNDQLTGTAALAQADNLETLRRLSTTA